VLLALARAESLRDFALLPDDLSFEPFANNAEAKPLPFDGDADAAARRRLV
jgi:hypothetical protein